MCVGEEKTPSSRTAFCCLEEHTRLKFEFNTESTESTERRIEG